MAEVVAEEELYRSCQILFGRDLKVSHEFLQYLQLSGIKKAYRMKAMELHPDRGFSQSLTLQQSMAHQFVDVHQAYEKLAAYLEARDKGIDFKSSPEPFFTRKDHGMAQNFSRDYSSGGTKSYKAPTGTQRRNGGDSELKRPSYGAPLDPKSLYRGTLPNCQLLFGRYLYYSGLISLHTIGQALIWQRSQRPRLGEIGRRLGWLNEQDTFTILRRRQDRQLFGELALKLGILTPEQLHIILLHQKNLHKRIGQYFVAKNYWDAVMLEEYIAAHRRHNHKVRDLSA